jgi:hypothetical protein
MTWCLTQAPSRPHDGATFTRVTGYIKADQGLQALRDGYVTDLVQR